MTFAEAVIKHRQAKGLTQERLAELSNLSLRTVQRIESDTVNPRAVTVELICNVLEFQYPEPEPPKPQKPARNKILWSLVAVLVIGVIAVAMFLSPKQEEPIGVQYKSNSTAVTELIFKADLAELKKIDWEESFELFAENDPSTPVTVGFVLQESAMMDTLEIKDFEFTMTTTTDKLDEIAEKMENTLNKITPKP